MLKKTESVPSPALRTTRSVQPSPSRSAATICAGSKPVASEPTHEATVAVGVERDRVILASTLASTGTWSVSGTQAMSREGLPGLTVTGGSKRAGLPGIPWR